MFGFLTHLVFTVLVVICGTVMADSMQEYKAKLVEKMMGCVKEYPISAEEVASLKKKQLLDTASAKCFMACFLNRAGITDENGDLAMDTINAVSEQYFADNPTKLKRVKEFAATCQSVNDMKLSGDDAKCERAALIYKCSVEHSPEVDLI